MILKQLPVFTFAVLTLASGLVHGMRTDRWTPSSDVQTAVKRLSAIPLSTGEWTGTEVPAEDLRGMGIQGSISRRYRNNRTGEIVSMMVVCGRPGPISVHTPDVCYGAAGFQAVEQPSRKEVQCNASQSWPIWTMRMKRPDVVSASLIDVYWSWNTGDGWVSPDNPRWTFARFGALYKLYVVADVPSKPSARKQDPCVDFMKTYLPLMEQSLSTHNSH